VQNKCFNRHLKLSRIRQEHSIISSDPHVCSGLLLSQSPSAHVHSPREKQAVRKPRFGKDCLERDLIFSSGDRRKPRSMMPFRKCDITTSCGICLDLPFTGQFTLAYGHDGVIAMTILTPYETSKTVVVLFSLRRKALRILHRSAGISIIPAMLRANCQSSTA
jgi:hypothetical protein